MISEHRTSRSVMYHRIARLKMSTKKKNLLTKEMVLSTRSFTTVGGHNQSFLLILAGFFFLFCYNRHHRHHQHFKPRDYVDKQNDTPDIPFQWKYLQFIFPLLLLLFRLLRNINSYLHSNATSFAAIKYVY